MARGWATAHLSGQGKHAVGSVDHIEVLSEAITQIPAAHRRRLLVRCDGSGASDRLVEWLVEQGHIRGRILEYSIGFSITKRVRDAVILLPA